MKSFKLTLLFFILFAFPCFSQINTPIDSSYAAYFEKGREIPYLHLNKTHFIKGEELWLQAYLLNLNTRKLHEHTSNLYCGIYDLDGRLKQQKLLYVDNGIATGNFKIDSTFTDNKYVIRASTSWMKNFAEDDSFNQTITIISNNKNLKSNDKESIDIQVLPEGGHLLNNTNASIGIIAKDANGNGIQLQSGEIRNQNNEVVSKFRFNKFGLAKGLFHYKAKDTYTIQATSFDGKNHIVDVPIAKQIGLSMQVQSPSSSFFKITLSTNNKSLKLLTNKSYNLIVHNAGSIVERKIILQPNVLTYDLLIPSKKFSKGVNIITLLNDKNQPLLERVVFNYDSSLFSMIDVVNTKIKVQDSTQLDISNNNAETLYLSASILPINSKATSNASSIYAKFLIEPFIKAALEDPNYYFTNTNRKKLYDLDLLLLTQGWSKYSWSNILNNPPNDFHPFEKGISIFGEINMNIKSEKPQISMLSKSNEILLFSDITSNRFSFNNIYLQDSSEVNFSIIGQKKLKTPKYVVNQEKLNKLPKTIQKLSSKEVVSNKEDKELIFSDFILETVVLDEVEIIGENKFKHDPRFSSANMNGLVIDKNDTRPLLSFISSNGFRINRNLGQLTISSSRRTLSIMSAPTNPRTTVFIDDIEEPADLYFLETLRVNDFEEIYFIDADALSKGGRIYLYTRPDSQLKSRKSKFSVYKIPMGFSESKEFYTPKYKSFTNMLFNNYGAIYWKSNISINPSETFNLTFPNLMHKEFKIIIEGITDDGKLISLEKDISFKKDTKL